jgi:hypothetical protein
MRVISALALAGLILLGAADRAPARIPTQMHCWALDSEFPVPCEQDDEDDEVSEAGFRLRGGSGALSQRQRRASSISIAWP